MRVRWEAALAILAVAAGAAGCSTSESGDFAIEFDNEDGLTAITAVVHHEDNAADNFSIPPGGTTRTYEAEAGHRFTIEIYQNNSATNFRDCYVTEAEEDAGRATFVIHSDGEGNLGELSCW